MFLVDSNILIEAKNRYYAFDIAPGFWDWLEGAYQQGLACSIDAVRDELLKGDDELAAWARANPDFFKSIDQSTTNHFSDLTAWATSGSYRAEAIAAFTGNNADYLLIAYAREHQHTVVTHERSEPNARRRILIPDACLAMGVSTADTFQMMRATGAVLNLRTSA
ncbi:DUF4411 family protein [Corynebacterium mayonis]|uniref:DUF4411 family protein n=1 Tax=Corynebacterium mayonis TaxID=3062461 RepID=UPI00313FFA5C